MSNFTDEYSTQHVICPYCQDTYEQEGGEFSEEERIDICSSCGKKFHHVDEIEYSHNTRPDCAINGIPHKWELHNFPSGATHDFCEICGEIKIVTRRVKE